LQRQAKVNREAAMQHGTCLKMLQFDTSSGVSLTKAEGARATEYSCARSVSPVQPFPAQEFSMSISLVRSAIVAAFVSAAAVGTASAANPVKVGDTSSGKAFVDAKGMTLYTFDKDSEGKSACNGPCLVNWPAVTATADDKSGDGFSVITRDDGSKQWAYKGKALYTFVKDTKAGDTTGDGVVGAWHIARP
jgi:predicted lipoprotein with Yx(FWY)xxD motif